MNITYNGISMTPVADFQITYEVITDESQLDMCFVAAHMSGSFMVNGQTAIRSLDAPPTSYSDSGADSTRPIEAVRTKPAGLPAPPVGAEGPLNSEGPERQKGAVTDELSLFLFPYRASVTSPAYATERTVVERLVAGPALTTVTWPLIYQRLLQPRGQLFVYENTGAANEIIIHSPGFNYHCDANGGPIPHHLQITHVQGDGVTFFVNWACTTYLRRLRRADINDPLLSNRWVMTHHIRDGSYTDIEVEGHAHFDLGIIHKNALDADNYRPLLLLPIPQGYERRDMEITESEDGRTIHYHFIDHQVDIMFPAGPYVAAVEIDGEHEQYTLCEDDVLGGMLGSLDSALNRKWLGDTMKPEKKEKKKKKGGGSPRPPKTPKTPKSTP